MKWLLTLLFIANAAFSQSILQGKVVDAATGQPLPAANVFVANTTYQTITNDSGLFFLRVPDADYNVIVTFVGYESVAVPSSAIKDFQTVYSIRLHPSTAVLKTVNIMRQADRAKYLQLFLDLFLGRTKNAQSAKILNQDDLYFDFNAATGVLEVSSDVALEIENPALNYHISFVLSHFSYDSKAHTSLFAGYPVFRDLKTLDSKRQQKVVKERKRAFLGSNIHFIRSAFTDSIAQNGFKIKKFRQSPNPEYRGDEYYANVWAEALRTKKFDSVKHVPPKLLVKFQNGNFSAADMIVERDGRKYLEFSDYFDIVYENERPERHYHGGEQHSQLHLRSPTIEIFADGSYANPDKVMFFGYMGWEKLADMLPFDYQEMD